MNLHLPYFTKHDTRKIIALDFIAICSRLLGLNMLNGAICSLSINTLLSICFVFLPPRFLEWEFLIASFSDHCLLVTFFPILSVQTSKYISLSPSSRKHTHAMHRLFSAVRIENFIRKKFCSTH